MKTEKVYTIKYRIKGALFRRAYQSRAARDSRADVLATNGVVVVCATKRRPFIKSPRVLALEAYLRPFGPKVMKACLGAYYREIKRWGATS